MTGLNNILLFINELEKSYLARRPDDTEIIKDLSGSFRYAIQKLIQEREGKERGKS